VKEIVQNKSIINAVVNNKTGNDSNSNGVKDTF
jgi:hypothetical protein